MIAVGAVNIPIFARLRGSILAQKENDFILAARSVGVPRRSILSSHIIPNSISPVIVQGTLAMATAIIDVAGLGFLGLGPQDPATPEWGTMLTGTVRYLQTAPHLAIIPGVAIVVSVLGFNLIGDGLREALDPKLRGRGRRASSHRRRPPGRVHDLPGDGLRRQRSHSTVAPGRRWRDRGRVGVRQERHVARHPRHPRPQRPCQRAGQRPSRAVTSCSCRTSSSGRSGACYIAMIFQDPMTSLNPVQTVGKQIREAIVTHFDLDKKEADERAASSRSRRHPEPEVRLKDDPHQFSGGMRQRAMIAMALACEPNAPDRGRAHDRARRHHPGADPRAPA